MVKTTYYLINHFTYPRLVFVCKTQSDLACVLNIVNEFLSKNLSIIPKQYINKFYKNLNKIKKYSTEHTKFIKNYILEHNSVVFNDVNNYKKYITENNLNKISCNFTDIDYDFDGYFDENYFEIDSVHIDKLTGLFVKKNNTPVRSPIIFQKEIIENINNKMIKCDDVSDVFPADCIDTQCIGTCNSIVELSNNTVNVNVNTNSVDIIEKENNFNYLGLRNIDIDLLKKMMDIVEDFDEACNIVKSNQHLGKKMFDIDIIYYKATKFLHSLGIDKDSNISYELYFKFKSIFIDEKNYDKIRRLVEISKKPVEFILESY